VPTVVLCSDEFGPLGRAEARALGFGGLALVASPHPLAGNSSDLVKAKAGFLASEVHRALTSPAATVAQENRERFSQLTHRRLEAGAVCLDEACVVDLSGVGQRS